MKFLETLIYGLSNRAIIRDINNQFYFLLQILIQHVFNLYYFNLKLIQYLIHILYIYKCLVMHIFRNERGFMTLVNTRQDIDIFSLSSSSSLPDVFRLIVVCTYEEALPCPRLLKLNPCWVTCISSTHLHIS